MKQKGWSSHCWNLTGILVNVHSGGARCEGGSVITSLLKAVSDILTLDALDAAPKSTSDDSSSQNGDDDMVTEGEEEGKAHTIDIGQVGVSFVHLEDKAHLHRPKMHYFPLSDITLKIFIKYYKPTYIRNNFI